MRVFLTMSKKVGPGVSQTLMCMPSTVRISVILSILLPHFEYISRYEECDETI